MTCITATLAMKLSSLEDLDAFCFPACAGTGSNSLGGYVGSAGSLPVLSAAVLFALWLADPRQQQLQRPAVSLRHAMAAGFNLTSITPIPNPSMSVRTPSVSTASNRVASPSTARSSMRSRQTSGARFRISIPPIRSTRTGYGISPTVKAGTGAQDQSRCECSVRRVGPERTVSLDQRVPLLGRCRQRMGDRLRTGRILRSVRAQNRRPEYSSTPGRSHRLQRSTKHHLRLLCGLRTGTRTSGLPTREKQDSATISAAPAISESMPVSPRRGTSPRARC